MKHLFPFLFALFLMPDILPAQFLFKDVSHNAGIDAHSIQIAEDGPGVVVFDLNGDGWDDVYMAGGQDSDKIYVNNGDGTFTNIAQDNFKTHTTIIPSGDTLIWRTNPRGGIAFDYDNDGHPDIYSVCENRDILWHNKGDNTFEDATIPAKLDLPLEKNESISATFGDFNGDGWNDFYVARWVDESRLTRFNDTEGVYAHKGFPNYFYINNHDGTFTESAKEYGVDGDTGCTHIALFFDYDRDGDLDLLIGNDFGVELKPNQVWKNMLVETGTASFVDVTKKIGLEDHVFAMGITPIDYDRDGNFDFFETSIGVDSLHRNMGKGSFKNVTASVMPEGIKIGPGGNGFERHGDQMTTAWTALAGDFDNDGWEDMLVVHGYVGVIPPWHTNDTTKKDTSIFYRNIYGVFQDYTDQALNGEYIDLRCRGAAYLDYDHDGKLDICIGTMTTSSGNFADPDFRLLKNISQPISANPMHWLEMRFTAQRTAKEAIGTIVDVWTDGIVSSRQVSTGGGFGSQNSLMQHVGLGMSTSVDSIVIYWPCDKYLHRQIDRYYNIPVDTLLNFVERMQDEVAPSIKSQSARIYPSPVHDILNVADLKPSVTKHFEIYDVLGIKQLVASGSDEVLAISAANLRAGCYVLRIITNGSVETKQFIKE